MMVPVTALVIVALHAAAGTADEALATIPEVSGDCLFPPAGTPLPQNARIAIVQRDLSVHDVTDGQDVVLSDVAGTDLFAPQRFLDLELTGRTALEVLASCPGCENNPVPLGWPVTESSDTDGPVLAEQDVVTHVGIDGKTSWGVSVCLPPLAVEEPALYALRAGDAAEVRAVPHTFACGVEGAPSGHGVFFYAVVPYTGDGKRVCIDAAAADVAGNVTPIPQTCVDLASPEGSPTGGCTASGGPGPLGLVLLVALAAPARRRVRFLR